MSERDFDAMLEGIDSDSSSDSDDRPPVKRSGASNHNTNYDSDSSSSSNDSVPPAPRDIQLSPPSIRHRFDSKDESDAFGRMTKTPSSSPSGPVPNNGDEENGHNDIVGGLGLLMKEGGFGDTSSSEEEEYEEGGGRQEMKFSTGNMMEDGGSDFSSDGEFDFDGTGGGAQRRGSALFSDKAEAKTGGGAFEQVLGQYSGNANAQPTTGFFAVKQSYDAKDDRIRQSQIDTFGFRGATSANIDRTTEEQFRNLAVVGGEDFVARPKGDAAKVERAEVKGGRRKESGSKMMDNNDDDETESESFGEQRLHPPLRHDGERGSERGDETDGKSNIIEHGTNRNTKGNGKNHNEGAGRSSNFQRGSLEFEITKNKYQNQNQNNNNNADAASTPRGNLSMQDLQSPADPYLRGRQNPPSPSSPLVLDGKKYKKDQHEERSMRNTEHEIDRQQAALYGNNDNDNDNDNDKDKNGNDDESWRNTYPRSYYDKPAPTTKAPPPSPANPQLKKSYSDQNPSKPQDILGFNSKITKEQFYMAQPKNLKMKKCYVVRTQTGLGLGLKQYLYSLFLEPPGNGKPGGGNDGDGKFLLSAKKKGGTKTSYYQITAELDGSGQQLGKLRGNWSGGCYNIYDGGLNPAKCNDPKDFRREMGVIGFEYDKMGPGRMKVYVPRINADGQVSIWRPSNSEDSIYSTLQAAGGLTEELKDRLISCNNKRPKWDPQQRGHVLNFKGRVTESSVKNFQLCCMETGDLTMLQFGRVKKNTFTLDFGYPLSAIQAFAICLASLDGKLADSKGFEMFSKKK